MSTDLVTLDFRGTAIRREGDWLHATDMHRAAGADPNKAPNRWLRLDSTCEYLAELSQIPIGSQDPNSFFRTNRGRPDLGGGTWLHRLAAVEYARYLDPAFAVFVNKVFLATVEPRLHDGVMLSDERLVAIVGAVVAPIVASLAASVHEQVRLALAEQTVNSNGTIGRTVAGKTICARLRSYADIATGEPRKSSAWKSAIKKADNKIRKDVGHAVRAWGSLPSPKLGDVTGALDDLIKTAHEVARLARQMSLPINPSPAA